MQPSPKDKNSEPTASTTLLVAVGDKDGRRASPYVHVTVPTPSTTNSDTPSSPKADSASSPAAPSKSPKETDSERVLSTNICGAVVDKDGNIIRRFCFTISAEPGAVPPQSGASPDTPATNDGLTEEDLWGGTQHL